MLKHATPRSSPSLSSTGSNSPLHPSKFNANKNVFLKRPMSPGEISFNERSVDCEGIKTATPLSKKESSVSGRLNIGNLLGEKISGSQTGGGDGIGPVITHGKAVVRRGLSFTIKKEDPDALSIRSVKSEGRGSSNSSSDIKPMQSKAVSDLTLENLKSTRVNSVPENKANLFIKNTPETITMKTDHQIENPKKVFGISKSDHPSLKSLLRLPGVYGHIPVPEGVSAGSPHVLNPDSLSLNSSDSFFSSNSGRTSSRSWSSNTSSNSNNTSDSSASNNSSTSEPTSVSIFSFLYSFVMLIN